MAEWNRGDAEMAIAVKRAELNRALSYKTRYDAEGHNICLALVRFTNSIIDVFAAYSNDSAIPESIRLGLNLIPDVYDSLSKEGRFGCDGMAQFHTEPKLLNYLCATLAVRQTAFAGRLPRVPFYRSVVEKQREQAITRAGLLKRPEDMLSVTLVTEINCCRTCTQYSVNSFRARFPKTPLHVIELGKKVKERVPAQFQEVKIATKK
jgi:hypothetical protein